MRLPSFAARCTVLFCAQSHSLLSPPYTLYSAKALLAVAISSHRSLVDQQICLECSYTQRNGEWEGVLSAFSTEVTPQAPSRFYSASFSLHLPSAPSERFAERRRRSRDRHVVLLVPCPDALPFHGGRVERGLLGREDVTYLELQDPTPDTMSIIRHEKCSP